MMRRVPMCSLIFMTVLLVGCATMPTGPSVMSLPGDNKSFEEFRSDDAVCRQFAYEHIGGVTAQEAAQRSATTSAVVGTVLGAAAGAAIGSASGDMGAGAAIGGGAGLLYGSAVGSSYASGSYYAAQRRYDHAYMQCMYAKGNQIPGYRRATRPDARAPRGRTYSPPPPPDYPPPPPESDE